MSTTVPCTKCQSACSQPASNTTNGESCDDRGLTVSFTLPTTVEIAQQSDDETMSPSPVRRSSSMRLHTTPVLECSHLKKRKDTDGKKVVNNYILLDTIGRGAYSKVKLCCHRSDHTFYACKILNRSLLQKKGISVDCDNHITSGLQKVFREIAILKKLRHPHIIALQEVINDPKALKIYLILELAANGELMLLDSDGVAVRDSSGVNRIPEVEARRVTRAVVRALRYAHENGIAHRDVKPQNILLTEDGDVKLSDFGVAAIIDGGYDCKNSTAEGTIPFLPPELLSKYVGVASDFECDLFKADVWSLGVTVFVMLMGVLPWFSKDPRTLLEAIRTESLFARAPPDAMDEISEDAKSFVQLVLRWNPSDRISLQQMAAHPWLFNAPSSETSSPSATAPSSPVEVNIRIGERDVQTVFSEASIHIAEHDLFVPSYKYVFVRRVPHYTTLHFDSFAFNAPHDDSDVLSLPMSVAAEARARSRDAALMSPFSEASTTASSTTPHSKRSASSPAVFGRATKLTSPLQVHQPLPATLQQAINATRSPEPCCSSAAVNVVTSPPNRRARAGTLVHIAKGGGK